MGNGKLSRALGLTNTLPAKNEKVIVPDLRAYLNRGEIIIFPLQWNAKYLYPMSLVYVLQDFVMNAMISATRSPTQHPHRPAIALELHGRTLKPSALA